MRTDDIKIINYNKHIDHLEIEIHKAMKKDDLEKVEEFKNHKKNLENRLEIINEKRERRIHREENRDKKQTAKFKQKLKPRYVKLLEIIEEVKPVSILEIGTWKGENAKRMVHEALQHNDHVVYYGYDLFEDANEQTDEEELNVKRARTMDEVQEILNLYKQQEIPENKTVEFHLFKGNTRDLKIKHNVDFVFIDGGHSIETIQNDYDKTKHNPVVVFDDYYFIDGDGNIPDLEIFGCNSIVDKIPGAEIYNDDNIDVQYSTDKPSNIKSEKGGVVGIAVVRK